MDRAPSDRDLRDLLLSLRDTFKEAAARIDDVLGTAPAPSASQGFRRDDERRPARDFNATRDVRGPRDFGAAQAYRGDNRGEGRGPQRDFQGGREPRDFRAADPAPFRGDARGSDPGVRNPLERLREEVRTISNDAPGMDPSLLRLKIEAVTAETRVLQPRINDPEDNDIAAKIMRSLTAIVSEHRPGHVYGLARHHQADWNDVSRRARDELRALEGPGGAEVNHAPKGEPDLDA
ncbi:MAG: hypothetical protein Q7V43_04565 [Myxococcales bacterium]|nr:hypothetical protein [Myxococcales bacterium]